MIGKERFIKKIKINDVLSFGSNFGGIELKSLNVLIGPNASGKSNFIEVIRLLQSASTDISRPIKSSGGATEWIWKGEKHPFATIQITSRNKPRKNLLRHTLFFEILNDRIYLPIENIYDGKNMVFNKSIGSNEAEFRLFKGFSIKDKIIQLNYTSQKEIIEPFHSVLSQRKGPEYREITYLGKNYSSIKIYKNLIFENNTNSRMPQKTDIIGDFLEEDMSNLVMVINDMDYRFSDSKKRIENKLSELYENFEGISVKLHGGMAQLYFREIICGKSVSIPSTRLSDGTLNFLCLLVILCHPEPPPLICIEEPEVGLHPDIIPMIAKLLMEASHRTQLIVTTHSDILVDALTKTPEAVLVCEKEEGSTTMRRLDEKKLKVWLKKYSLGELWLNGEIGGTRW
jgi:predicted ATPase